MDTKEQLLDAAEAACRRRGYDGFSYADLSSAVGIRKASIHHHFPTKAELTHAMVDRYRAQVMARLEKAARRTTTGADRLRAYVALYRAALAGGQALCLCVSLSAGRDSLSGPVLSTLNQFHDDSVDWLESAFTVGESDASVSGVGNIGDEAAATLALVEGAQLVARAARSAKPFDRATAQFLARLK